MPHEINEEDFMMEKKVKEKYTGPRVKDTETFIQKSRWVHGDKYDYSKVEYVNAKTKVIIICKNHGQFKQKSENHMAGKGCPQCGKLNSSGKRLRSTSWFIDKSKERHGDKYDYSEANYMGIFDKVLIRCTEHGIFKQAAKNHIDGSGCPECVKDNLGAHNKVPLEDFLVRATESHGGFYKYDKVSYVTLRDKVTIICPKHGEYLQRAGEHMRGKGCRDCWLESYGYGVNGYYGTDKPSSIYVFKVNNEFIKIGLSNNVCRRMLSIAKQSGYSVEKILQVDGVACELFDLEQHILRDSCLNQFTPQHKFNGISECLELSELPKVLQIIEEWEKNQQLEEEIEEDA